jgi:hypothetical protein
MIVLLDKETGHTIGEITPQELQILVDAFEEEGREDHDYYIDATSPEYLETQFEGAGRVAGLLKAALGTRDGFDVQWVKR